MTVPRIAEVTAAQRDVIRELAHDGADNAQIADRLDISVDTVKAHLKAAMGACGEPTRTALVVALLRGRVVLRTVNRSRREWSGRE